MKKTFSSTCCFNIKKIIYFFCFISLSFFLTACEKQVCSYCGQEAYCEEYDILGTVRYICDDCLGDPLKTLSGNVITEYESSLVDPELYAQNIADAYNAEAKARTASVTANSVSEDAVSSDSIAGQSSADTVIPASETEAFSNDETAYEETVYEDPASTEAESEPLPAAASDTPASTQEGSSSGISIETQGKDYIIAEVSSRLSKHSMYLMPQDENDTLFALYLNDTYINIDFDFTGSTSSKAKLCISKKQDATDTNYTTACIDASIGFIGSGDYSGEGYNIFNLAYQYGNYTYNGCRFYYTPSSDKEIADGGALIKYEISFQ